tara:strand:- start:25 stop:495 length:471 start_codon:yes stop_codon:yes gene_type:complete
MTKSVIKVLIFLIITSGCGYKVLKYSELSKFEINKIEVTGNNEINFKIKRKLNSLSKVGSDNKIDIYLQTSKSKFVKEKDSKNEVSKYQIDIVTELEVTSTSNVNILNFSIKKTNDFIVDTKQSKTYEKEKKITDLLIDETLDEIVDKLLLELNDI